MSPANAKLNAFPVFMRVDGQAVAIVGNGEEALAKARLVSQSSVVLRIVADNASRGLLDFIASTGAVHINAAYEAAYLRGAALVFAASGDEALDPRRQGLTVFRFRFMLTLCNAEVAEWQTRRTQNPVG